MKKKLTIAAVVAATVAAGAGLAILMYPTPSGTARATGPPAVVEQVPDTIPADGVKLRPGVDDIVLMPLTSERESALAIGSARGAVAAGPKVPKPNPTAPPRAVQASVTVGSTLENSEEYRIVDRAAWVITYTSSEPVAVQHQRYAIDPDPDRPPDPLVSHLNIIIDAETGKFLLGFYTE